MHTIQGAEWQRQWSNYNLSISSYLTDNEIMDVCALAKKAGELALNMYDGLIISEKSGPHDRVTDADVQLSKLITSYLKEKYRDDLVISEEDDPVRHYSNSDLQKRIWLIDPIDGTDNYIRNDGQYAVMIGLLVDLKPVFGFVYAPFYDHLYFGGPQSGAWFTKGQAEAKIINNVSPLSESQPITLMMGFRDRKAHPWIDQLKNVQFVKAGSVGLKVEKVLNNEADIFVHLSGRMKVWDTAAPVAIALGAGLEVGCLDKKELDFPLPAIEHSRSIVIGRPGSLLWSYRNIKKAEVL